MQYLLYGRDRPGAGATRKALLKAHWAFMRPYIGAMSARGPTMAADGTAVTGSLHIVDLPDAAAAGAFARDDPLARGGVFEDILVRRFRNMAGRTMWQFAGDANNRRFLFLGEAQPAAAAEGRAWLDAQVRYLGEAARAAQVIVWGPLLGDDGETWAGTALLLETRDVAAAEALLRGEPAAHAYVRTALHPWRFGGEENLQDLIAGGA
jgi:uncharacterized protein YciI